MKYISTSIALLTSTLLCACATMRPGLPDAPTQGPPLYLQGWNEGCETGANIYGNDYMRVIYANKINTSLMKNPVYRNAWRVGQSYCRFYVSTYLMQGFVADGFGRGVFDGNVLPAGENMRDSLWGNGEDLEIFQGFNLPGWEVGQGLSLW